MSSRSQNDRQGLKPSASGLKAQANRPTYTTRSAYQVLIASSLHPSFGAYGQAMGYESSWVRRNEHRGERFSLCLPMPAFEFRVLPALHNENLSPIVIGRPIALAGVHAKVRRDGYRTDVMPVMPGPNERGG